MSAAATDKPRVPELRFPEFAGEWASIGLGEIGTVIRGASPRPKGDPRYYGGRVPRLMGEDVTRDGRYVTPKIDFLTEAGARLSRPCVAGTLTIVCSGTVGVPSILAIDACIHDGFLALIDIDPNYDKEFLFDQLSRLQARFNSSATHGGVFVNLTTTILREFVTSFPSLPEQKKIAGFLGAVDGKLGALREKEAALTRFKRGLMQQLFSQTRRFTRADGSPYPDWEEKRLGDVFDWVRTNNLSRQHLTDKDTGLQNIHYGDIHTKFSMLFKQNVEQVPYIAKEADFAPTQQEYCRVGDVIIADASEDYADIGKAIEIIETYPNTLVSGLHTYIARPKNKALALGFSGYLFASYALRLQIMKIAQGTSVLGISKTNLEKLEILLPHPEEQQKIADALSAIDAKIAAVAGQIEQAQAFKRGLLQKMFV